jgi:hypothetical protein
MDNFDLDSFDSSVSGTATTGSHELEELKRINERRDFWEGRGDIDPRSWANENKTPISSPKFLGVSRD